jgi:hypothetical protein
VFRSVKTTKVKMTDENFMNGIGIIFFIFSTIYIILIICKQKNKQNNLKEIKIISDNINQIKEQIILLNHKQSLSQYQKNEQVHI